MEFKKGSTYLTKMGDGGMVKLSSVFTVISGEVEHHTLYGCYVGYEDLGEWIRFWPSGLLKEVTWQDYFDRWLKVRLERMDWYITKKLEEKLK